MDKFARAALVASIVSAASACAGDPKIITSTSVKSIEVCHTTKKELVAMYGPPSARSQSASSQTSLRWTDENGNQLFVMVNSFDVVVDWVRNPVGTYTATNRCEKR